MHNLRGYSFFLAMPPKKSRKLDNVSLSGKAQNKSQMQKSKVNNSPKPAKKAGKKKDKSKTLTSNLMEAAEGVGIRTTEELQDYIYAKNSVQSKTSGYSN